MTMRSRIRSLLRSLLLKVFPPARAIVDRHVAAISTRDAEIILSKAEVADRDAKIVELQWEVSRLSRARSRLSSRVRALQQRPIPVAFGFDVEPDRRVVDLADPSWRATPLLFEKWERLREELSFAGQLPITWYPRADPQVEKANGSFDWALRNFGDDWRRLAERGDEVGLHMHPWRWDDTDKQWTQDHGDDQWVLYCLRSALTAFRGALGKTPAAYRGGDRFLTTAVANALFEEGVTVDLTLERMPAVDRLVDHERGTGRIPDGTMVPQGAYIASKVDVRIPAPDGSIGLGILPLTAGDNGTLIPWLRPDVFDHGLERVLGGPDVPTHLAFIARSDIAIDQHWEYLARNVRALAERVEEGQLAFMSASDTWAALSRQLSQRGLA